MKISNLNLCICLCFRCWARSASCSWPSTTSSGRWSCARPCSWRGTTSTSASRPFSASSPSASATSSRSCGASTPRTSASRSYLFFIFSFFETICSFSIRKYFHLDVLNFLNLLRYKTRHMHSKILTGWSLGLSILRISCKFRKR